MWPLPFGVGDVVDVYFDPQSQRYVSQGKTNVIGPSGETGWKRGVVRATSVDFINWTYPELVLSADEIDLSYDTDNTGLESIQLHSAPAFFYPRSGHYFGLMQKWNCSNQDTIAIELVVSRDGVRWNRPFRHEYWLPCSPTAAFDGDGVGHCSLWTSSTPVIMGDELLFYYGAYYHGLANADHLSPNQTGVGLATIGLDRFAGLQALRAKGAGQEPISSRTFCLPHRPCSAPNGTNCNINANFVLESSIERAEIMGN